MADIVMSARASLAVARNTSVSTVLIRRARSNNDEPIIGSPNTLIDAAVHVRDR
jgi:hypothetical protein